jgi:protein SCO1/2
MGASPAVAHQDPPARSGDAPAAVRRTHLPVIRPAPDFALVSHLGTPLRLSDLRGKVVLLDFFYASCSDICPAISGKMAVVQGLLKSRGTLAKQVVLLSASFDPEADTAEALRQYAGRLRASPDGWLFLRGDDTAIGRILRAYDVWVRRAPDGTFDHAERVYLIDRQGRIREIYSYAFFAVEQVLLDIESLL